MKFYDGGAGFGGGDVFAGKVVLMGVCGGVSFYKSFEILRALQRRGVRVRVALSAGAQRFVSAVGFEALTGERVACAGGDFGAGGANSNLAGGGANFGGDFGGAAQSCVFDHLEFSKADAILLVPATANTIAKVAGGIADDLFLQIILACNGADFCGGFGAGFGENSCENLCENPAKIVAPAMNPRMFANPATQRNLRTLQSDGWEVIAPVAKRVACGESGVGGLASVEVIVAHVLRALARGVLGRGFGRGVGEKNCAENRADFGGQNGAKISATTTPNSNLAANGAKNPLTLAQNPAPCGWRGRRVIVTGGATCERLDDVRGLTNFSSGKFAKAIADAFFYAGAEVTLIHSGVEVGADFGENGAGGAAQNGANSNLNGADAGNFVAKNGENGADFVAKNGENPAPNPAQNSAPNPAIFAPAGTAKFRGETLPYACARFESSRELSAALVAARLGAGDLLVMNAAVSDFVPRHRASGKVKKRDFARVIELDQNADILATLAAPCKKVGFKLEMSTLDVAAQNALKSLQSRGLDAVCLNVLAPSGAGDFGAAAGLNLTAADGADGTKKSLNSNLNENAAQNLAQNPAQNAAQNLATFGSDKTQIYFFAKDGTQKCSQFAPKSVVALELVDFCAGLF